jgi:hypothetical protein
MNAQIASVIRLELMKTFFSRRGLWVYLLAFAPALLYLIHAIDVTRDHEHRQALAAAHPVATEALRSIKEGATAEQLFGAAGEPYSSRTIPQGRRARAGGFRNPVEKCSTRACTSTCSPQCAAKFCWAENIWRA